MGNGLYSLQDNLHLMQSELFKEVYIHNKENILPTFNEVSINDVEDWFNSLITKYNFLNKIQVENLRSFFVKLKFVLENIDPNKLDIKNSIVESTDLVLWRESNNGISKLIFDEYGQIVYTFNGNQGRKIKGIFDSHVDMEKLLYKFITA